MSEPITLRSGKDVRTVYAPSEALELQQEGWTVSTVDNAVEPYEAPPVPVVAPVAPVADDAPVRRRRGRKASK